jgi:pyridoxine 5-phosphate synthase
LLQPSYIENAYIPSNVNVWKPCMASASRRPLSLLINIDHVATLRNARNGKFPDIVHAARTCIRAGADGVVCHLREDRRHIRDEDVWRLRHEIRTKLDLEMAATPEIIRIALRTRPDLVTLVPERRFELTTEGGLDVARQLRKMKDVVARFHDHGIPVSLFVDPEYRQLDASRSTGAEWVELHTGDYADAATAKRRAAEFRRLRSAAVYARTIGLGVNAGHGLNYTNVRRLAALPAIGEMSIGYAIIVRALSVGLETAVREMVLTVQQARGA